MAFVFCECIQRATMPVDIRRARVLASSRNAPDSGEGRRDLDRRTIVGLRVVRTSILSRRFCGIVDDRGMFVTSNSVGGEAGTGAVSDLFGECARLDTP